MSFELNYSYHSQVSYKENIYFYIWSKSVKGSTSKPVSIALTIALGDMLSVNKRSLVTCRVM